MRNHLKEFLFTFTIMILVFVNACKTDFSKQVKSEDVVDESDLRTGVIIVKDQWIGRVHYKIICLGLKGGIAVINYTDDSTQEVMNRQYSDITFFGDEPCMRHTNNIVTKDSSIHNVINYDTFSDIKVSKEGQIIGIENKPIKDFKPIINHSKIPK